MLGVEGHTVEPGGEVDVVEVGGVDVGGLDVVVVVVVDDVGIVVDALPGMH